MQVRVITSKCSLLGQVLIVAIPKRHSEYRLQELALGIKAADPSEGQTKETPTPLGGGVVVVIRGGGVVVEVVAKISQFLFISKFKICFNLLVGVVVVVVLVVAKKIFSKIFQF